MTTILYMFWTGFSGVVVVGPIATGDRQTLETRKSMQQLPVRTSISTLETHKSLGTNQS